MLTDDERAFGRASKHTSHMEQSILSRKENLSVTSSISESFEIFLLRFSNVQYTNSQFVSTLAQQTKFSLRQE